MAEWIESEGQWVDNDYQQWEGDVDFAVTAAITLTAAVPAHSITILVEVAVACLTISINEQDVSVWYDCAVSPDSLAITGSVPASTLTIHSTFVCSAALTMTMAVPAHVGSHATIIYPFRIQIVSRPLSIGLTINSTVSPDCFALVISIDTEFLAGVVTAVDASTCPTMAITLNEIDLLVTSVSYDLPAALTMASVFNAHTVEISSSFAVPSKLSIAATRKAVTLAIVSVITVSTIEIAYTIKDIVIVVENVIEPASLPIAATLNAVTLGFDFQHVVTSAISMEFGISNAGISFFPSLEPDTIEIEVTLNASTVTIVYSTTVTVAAALAPAITYPATSLEIDSNVAQAADIEIALAVLAVTPQISGAYAPDALEVAGSMLTPGFIGALRLEYAILSSNFTNEISLDCEVSVRMTPYG